MRKSLAPALFLIAYAALAAFVVSPASFGTARTAMAATAR